MTGSRTVVYCFSGAGNSVRFATRLVERLENATLIRLTKKTEREPIPVADSVGIVFPVIMMGIPGIVSRFLKRVTAAKGTYFFAIAANGGKMAGSLNQVAGILRARGLSLSAGFSVIMHRLNADPDAFAERLTEVTSTVVHRLSSPPPAVRISDRLLMTGIGNGLARLVMPTMDRSFRANDRCDGCAVCAKICPAENIAMVSGRPVWHHRCEQCLACLHWCPRAGLDYGKNTQMWIHKCPAMDLAEFAGEEVGGS